MRRGSDGGYDRTAMRVPEVDRRVTSLRTAGLLAALAVALSTASSMFLPMPVWLLVPVVCCVVLWIGFMIAVMESSTTMHRCVLAAAIGIGGAWSSVAWNQDSCDRMPLQQWPAWRADRGLSTTPYPTLVVGGWPLRLVEGHGHGGAPERLPFGKGLVAMHANVASWFAAAWLLSLAIPAGWLPLMGIVSLLAGVAGYFMGFARLIVMLD